ncbi:uncharacterized protein LOC119678796 [Teleopsis dalmanni]|uniref:uncharacterized protein LOC119678796 n=1 Tax=Teleopsis dalmanni TaxID=139649 RepID=UPI0018CCC37E|nr:uncharacterized protein LOC119678796 [Teleopsis dalmanni]
MSLIGCQLLVTVTATLLVCLLAAVPPTTINEVAAANIENDILYYSYELERWVDVNQRPCQDFYGYVCGKSLNTTQAQYEQRLQQEQQKFDNFLTADNDELLLDAELKLKQFYDSCKHARTIDDLKSTLMYRFSGGWPAIDDSAAMIRKRRNMTWMGVVGAFNEVGLEYFFRHRVDIKSNKRTVLLEPDDSTRYTLRKYEQLAGEVLQEYAVDAGRARLVALEILNFERSRREILKAEVADGELEFNYVDFKLTLSAAALKIDWDAYFKKILGKPLKPSDTVLVRQMPKLVELFGLLQNTTMTRLLNWIWIDYLMDKSSSNCQMLTKNYFEPVYQHVVVHSSVDKVQMAQMYADLGRAYEELLPSTAWIDEMSQQNSKQFQSRIIHLTLNGDEKLDADLATVTITKRNFYRNLEKTQRFLAQKRKEEQRASARVTGNAIEVSQAATDFMKIFLAINALLPQQNLSTPLNYALVGEHFAEQMIATGSSSTTPGAWRSMDSEREFGIFKHCIDRQTANTAAANYNSNDLVLKLLAQQQTLHAFEQWQQKNLLLMRRLDTLLAAGRLQLSMRKLYFVGSVMTNCRLNPSLKQKELVHRYLRNSQAFTLAFGCRINEDLYARNICKVL